MRKKVINTSRLNKFTFDKLDEFSRRKGVSKSEIMRALLNDKSIKLYPRAYGKIVRDAKSRNDVNTFRTSFNFTDMEKEKIRKLAKLHKSTQDEILRELIANANLVKYF